MYTGRTKILVLCCIILVGVLSSRCTNERRETPDSEHADASEEARYRYHDVLRRTVALIDDAGGNPDTNLYLSAANSSLHLYFLYDQVGRFSGYLYEMYAKFLVACHEAGGIIKDPDAFETLIKLTRLVRSARMPAVDPPSFDVLCSGNWSLDLTPAASYLSIQRDAGRMSGNPDDRDALFDPKLLREQGDWLQSWLATHRARRLVRNGTYNEAVLLVEEALKSSQPVVMTTVFPDTLLDNDISVSWELYDTRVHELAAEVYGCLFIQLVDDILEQEVRAQSHQSLKYLQLSVLLSLKRLEEVVARIDEGDTSLTAAAFLDLADERDLEFDVDLYDSMHPILLSAMVSEGSAEWEEVFDIIISTGRLDRLLVLTLFREAIEEDVAAASRFCGSYIRSCLSPSVESDQPLGVALAAEFLARRNNFQGCQCNFRYLSYLGYQMEGPVLISRYCDYLIGCILS